MTSKVALGIFWDIENCPVPPNKSASSLAKCLRDFIAATHPLCGYAKEFFCVCDTRRVDQRLLEGLDKNGVVVVHVNCTAKNAADDKLQELMDMFVDKYGTDGSAVLCMITGDINFAKPIRNARRKDLIVVLLHGINCSPDLKNLANESYLYDDVISSAENVAKVDNQLKPVFLEVLNLPTDQQLVAILGRLSHLSANCGGKPDTISKGKGLIRFGCKEDAQRCLQRINGENVCGNKILVRFAATEPAKDLRQKPFIKQNSSEQNTGLNNRVGNRSLSQNNLAKSSAKSQTDLTQVGGTSKDVGDGCQSILIGIPFKKNVSAKERVKDMINSWNDSKLKGDMVLNAYNGKTSAGPGKVRDVIHVTAISREASFLLVKESKKYLKETSIKWVPKTPKQTEPTTGQNSDKGVAVNNVNTTPNKNSFVDNDCKSVIRGLDTKKDDMVAKMVRKIVESWSDKSVQPNYITKVERDRKYADKDGTVLLFVTARNPDCSKALVMAAKKFLKNGIKWTAYKTRKPNASKDTDTESNVSDFEYISSQHSSMNDLTDRPSTQAIEKPNDDVLSVITGLETKKGENVAKIVRKMLMSWKNPKINGNLIRDVNRFPDFPDIDGKIPLVVEAVSTSACEALVAGAEQYLEPGAGIIWSLFKSGSTSGSVKPKISSAEDLIDVKPDANVSAPTLPVKPLPTIVSKIEGIEAIAYTRPLPVQLNAKPAVSTEAINRMEEPVPKGPVSARTRPKPISTGTNFLSKATMSTGPLANNLSFVAPVRDGPQLAAQTAYKPQVFSTSISSTKTIGLNCVQSSPYVAPYNAMTVPQTSHSRRDDSDGNMFQSLVSGFESLFKSSKSTTPPPKKSVLKPLNSALFTDTFIKSMTPLYYPPVPYKLAFNSSLRNGFTVCINGRLSIGADCFAIDFLAKTDIAFHLNVRHRQQLVVRNSNMKGVWGPEEREISGYPFIVGQGFEIIIRIESDRYVIAVNRQTLCDYEHRIALNLVTGLHISGDISLECLRFT